MRKLRAVVFGVLVLGTVGLLAREVWATHIAGRTYTGTYSGGTVSLTISSTGNQLSFTVDPAGACAPVTLSNRPITDHAFSGASVVTPTVNARGSFTVARQVSGVLSFRSPAAGCSDVTNTAWSASTGVTPTPTPTRTPTPTGTQLPKTGSPAAVIGLSGLTALEAGFGLRMLSRRLQMPMRAVPLYLLRRLVRAERRGEGSVEVAEGWYLMRRHDGDQTD